MRHDVYSVGKMIYDPDNLIPRERIFFMTHYSTARKNMVDCQIHTSGVATPAVLEAFETLPREQFVPQAYREVSYMGEDLLMGNGRFLLEPAIHARMVEALDIERSDIVLEVGVNYGYAAAILSQLASMVVSVCPAKNDADRAEAVWADLGLTNVAAFAGDLLSGWAKEGPYDHIMVSGAVSEVPQSLVEQLAPGGTMVLVEKQPDQAMGRVLLVRRNEAGAHDCGAAGYSFVPLFEAASSYLPGCEPKAGFSF